MLFEGLVKNILSGETYEIICTADEISNLFTIIRSQHPIRLPYTFATTNNVLKLSLNEKKTHIIMEVVTNKELWINPVPYEILARGEMIRGLKDKIKNKQNDIIC